MVTKNREFKHKIG